MQQAEVLIVGAGPTGLTLAALLGLADIPTLVVERDPSTSELPKAVSFDDESLRAFQRAGLTSMIYDVILPGTGTKYYGAHGREVAYAHGPRRPRLGHPIKNPFQQPELEAQLAKAASDLPSVDVHFSTELTTFDQDAAGITAVLRRTDGSTSRVRASYLVGADGGRSTVRTQLGIEMNGLSFEQPWIVIDTLGDPHRQRYAMHHGDPARPHVIVTGRDGFCRYEFLLRPGESFPGDDVPFDFVATLLEPYRSITPADILRSTVYTFHALVADRWTSQRVFLAGDAAHMMPPFAGQGLNSGIRDADNLSWKLADVLQGRLRPEVLDSYEQERRPHAEATVDFSARMGKIVMTTSRPRAWLRDAVLSGSRLLPPLRRYLQEMRFKPTARYEQGLVLASGRTPAARRLVGTSLPQPPVLLPSGQARLLDDVLGSGFSVVAVGDSPEQRAALAEPVWEELDAHTIVLQFDDLFPRLGEVTEIGDVHGDLTRELVDVRGHLLLVRPDRYVAACFQPHEWGVVEPRIRDWVAGSWAG